MRNLRRFRAVASCALLTVTSVVASAQTNVSWSGGGGGAWSVAGNWMPNQVPNNSGSLSFVATVNSPGPLVNGGFTITGLNVTDQVLLNGGSNLGFGSPSSASFINGTGSINIQPQVNQAPTAIILQANNTLTLSGNGLMALGGLGTARVLGAPGSTFDNTNWRITGEGNFIEGFAALRNGGVITAAGGTLNVVAAGYTNTNLMVADAGAVLRLSGGFGSINNSGTIVASGGLVQFSNNMQITGGNLLSTSGGSFELIGSGGGTHRFRSLVADANVVVPGNTLEIQDIVTNRGSISINGGTMRIVNAATLTGGGTVFLSNAAVGAAAFSTLTVNAGTIRGTGMLGNDQIAIDLGTDAIVRASGGSLTVNPAGFGLLNNGTMLADGGTLVLTGLNSGSFINGGGRVIARNDSNVVLTGGALLEGGTLSAGGNGTASIPSSNTARLDGVTIDLPLVIGVSATGRFSGDITGTGDIQTSAQSRIRIDGTASINVNGTLMQVGSVIEPGDQRDARGLGPDLFNNSVIRGAGTIGLNGLKITNNGTIRADQGTAQAPQTLWIDPSPEGLLNAGIMESTNFGVLVLSGSGGGAFDQQGTALIRALGDSSNVRLAGQQVSVTGGQFGSGLGSISVDGGTTATLTDLTSDALLTTGLGIGTIVVNNNLVNTGTVSLPSSGRLVVAGASTLNSGSGHILNNGSITVTNNGNLDANFIEGTGSLLVQTGGTLRAHAIRQGRLTIDNGGFAHLKSAFTGSADPSRVGSLSIGAAPAFLDVANRVLIIDQSGTVALNTLRASIISGYNGGAWDGPGIRSSSAAANPGHGVGYGEASAIFGSFPATYFGQTIDNTTLLVTYTRYGDANLDRAVNLQDFNRLASNFGGTIKLWTDGDFTYDGLVSLADFNRLASNFGLGAAGPEVTPADWAALAAAVPEPALVTICALALLGMMRHSRRAALCAALGAVMCASQPLLAQTNQTSVGSSGGIWHDANGARGSTRKHV